MPQINPLIIRLQVDHLINQGQPFFAEIKVQDWLKARGHNPHDYEIIFHDKMAALEEKETKAIILTEIELRRRDGQSVDPWLQAEINRYK